MFIDPPLELRAWLWFDRLNHGRRDASAVLAGPHGPRGATFARLPRAHHRPQPNRPWGEVSREAVRGGGTSSSSERGRVSVVDDSPSAVAVTAAGRL